MPKYRFKERYGATYQTGGRNVPLHFEKGDSADLDVDVADFINRDCPGVMVRAKGTAKKAAAKE